MADLLLISSDESGTNKPNETSKDKRRESPDLKSETTKQNETSRPKDKRRESSDSQNQDSSDSQNQDSSDSYYRESSESPPYDVNSLPDHACSWRRDDVENLKIYIDESTYSSPEPMNIIKHKLLKGMAWSGDGFVNQVSAAIENLEVYRHLDCNFNDLTMDKYIVRQLAFRRDMWDIKIPGQNETLTEFKACFRNAGKWFTENLLKCIHLKDQGMIISESMYQQMFTSFLQLFNIKCNISISKRNVKIHSREITGKPDVMIEMLHCAKKDPYNPQPALNWKTLVVCEVKKECKRSIESHSRQTRFTSQRPSAHPTSLPDGLLGQNFCELLLYHPSSLNDDNIIGMIVEQTHITFTALSLTKEQYKKMTLEGNLKDNVINGPKFFISKSYDYLIQADRTKLTQALLTIGYLQNHGLQEPLT